MQISTHWTDPINRELQDAAMADCMHRYFPTLMPYRPLTATLAFLDCGFSQALDMVSLECFPDVVSACAAIHTHPTAVELQLTPPAAPPSCSNLGMLEGGTKSITSDRVLSRLQVPGLSLGITFPPPFFGSHSKRSWVLSPTPRLPDSWVWGT